ncbi:unnamed protein product [Allacma fusca]|uniref:Partial AB-hydrolase lipase domain-containing protein n=1 Tax=Allacma fusca TaxID=39272 RepID=A0A8J2KW25_9HEXA|nr:unnamed protein product [Allacma fusca]
MMRCFRLSLQALFPLLFSIGFFLIIVPNNAEEVESNSINITGQLKVQRECDFKLDYNKEAHLSTPQIIGKYGLPVETHELETLDGFVLKMFRIPAPNKPPVFLSHGFACSSRCFVINCDRRALAIKLADEGFDVWLGNYRGNEYSEKHQYLTKANRRYWNHGIDELAMYDAPAMIDYVLWITKQPRLNWIGHGLGSAYIIGLLALKPNYNDKVNMGFTLGAVTGVYNHIPHPILKQFVAFERPLYRLGMTAFGGKMLPGFVTSFWHKLHPTICARDANTKQFGLCLFWQFLFDGYHPGQIKPEALTMLSASYPNDVSVKIFSQWLQWLGSHRVAQFNHGHYINLLRYGTPGPPPYDLRKITSWRRIVHFYGENDWYIHPEDVRDGAAKYPGSTVIRVNDSMWNHLDFILGQDADTMVYKTIVEKLRQPGIPAVSLPQESRGYYG